MRHIAVKDLPHNVLKLPRLPIPPLDATFDRYRMALRPLRSGEAVAAHLRKLDNFLQLSAPTLQKSIIANDAIATETGTYPFSYVEPLLDAASYSDRAPLAVNLHPGFALKRDIKGTDNTQTGVAAAMAHGLATWIKNAMTHGVAVTSGQEDLSPILSQFGRSRVPFKEMDEVHTTPSENLRHVVVLHDGHPYMVRLFDDDQNVLDRSVIQKAMELVLSITPDEDYAASLSVLTAGNRIIWGTAYQELIKTPENAATMQLFHESIMAICLDSRSWGVDDDLVTASALHGGKEELENRWYDKHQMIISADGQVAFNLDPSGSQRPHWIRWIEDVLEIVAQQPASSVSTASVDGAKMSTLVRPLYVTFGKSFAAHIRATRQEVGSLVAGVDVHSVCLPYGRAQLSALQIEPDAFAQLCFQLAYFSLRDRLGSTLHLCDTTRYFHGTTEVARAATEEVLLVGRTVAAQRSGGETDNATTPSTPTVSTTNKQELQQLIHAAAKKHMQLTEAACCGEGIDRHLMALRSVATVNGDKAGLAFFEDDMYAICNRFSLKSAGISRPWLRYYLCGPAHANGYGIGYVVDENELRVSFSAYTNSPSTNIGDYKAAMLTAADTIYRTLGGTDATN